MSNHKNSLILIMIARCYTIVLPHARSADLGKAKKHSTMTSDESVEL